VKLVHHHVVVALTADVAVTSVHAQQAKPKMSTGIPSEITTPDTVKNFWSVGLYDTQTRSELQTDQQFPSIGSQRKDIGKNADGSVDIYFSLQAPAGQESNWTQTVPGKSWWIILRLYGPLQPWFDRTWRPGDIELVQ
jgi:hypothetical protein